MRYLLAWIADRRPFFLDRGLSVSFSCEGYLSFAVDRAVRANCFCHRHYYRVNFADGTISGCNNNSPDFYQGSVASADLRSMGYRVSEGGTTVAQNRRMRDMPEWKYCHEVAASACSTSSAFAFSGEFSSDYRSRKLQIGLRQWRLSVRRTAATVARGEPHIRRKTPAHCIHGITTRRMVKVLNRCFPVRQASGCIPGRNPMRRW